MKIPLLCHWSGDGDIARSFLEYYIQRVSTFHLILHRSTDVNREILNLAEAYPIIVHGSYDGPFDDAEKQRRLNEILPEFEDQWLWVVDSDEFVELPYDSLEETIHQMTRVGSSCLPAPMLQRLKTGGSLISAERVQDIQAEFPLCSIDLYSMMGSSAWLGKFPLFRCVPNSSISLGNHHPANGPESVGDTIFGVTHHFKWRRSVVRRLSDRIAEEWEWASIESAQYLRYLETHDFQLPLEGAFEYSRQELFKRQLLRRPT